MTKVLCSIRRDNIFFDCEGHSTFKNEEGYNHVCAEASTLCCMLVRYISDKGYDPVICKDGHVRIDIYPKAHEAEVFKAAMLEFTAIAERYPEHIKVY